MLQGDPRHEIQAQNAYKLIKFLKYIKILRQQGAFSIFYFHVNGSIGIVQKIDFEIRPDLGCTTLKT